MLWKTWFLQLADYNVTLKRESGSQWSDRELTRFECFAPIFQKVESKGKSISQKASTFIKVRDVRPYNNNTAAESNISML